jgi:hypothetical protein
VTLSLGQSDMSEPRITGVSLVLVMGRQGSWCPALCREVLLDVVLSCVSHGPSLGYFRLLVIENRIRRL